VSARMRARSTARADGLDKVRALQRVLYRSAKQQPDRRFHALFDKVARSDILFRAWDEVRRNRGAPGVDGVTIDAVEASGVAAFLEHLAAQLRAGTYRPRPLRRVLIPKPGQPGRTRPLGIPCVRDRVVMTAAKLVLEPVFEADFLPQSYGFRPRRSARQACEVIRVEATAAPTGCLTPTSGTVSGRSGTMPCSPWWPGGSRTGRCCGCSGRGCGWGCSRTG
jgi:RNA-directed DNA polymerase